MSLLVACDLLHLLCNGITVYTSALVHCNVDMYARLMLAHPSRIPFSSSANIEGGLGVCVCGSWPAIHASEPLSSLKGHHQIRGGMTHDIYSEGLSRAGQALFVVPCQLRAHQEVSTACSIVSHAARDSIGGKMGEIALLHAVAVLKHAAHATCIYEQTFGRRRGSHR